MNGGWPVIATLIFPDFSIRIVSGIISTGDRKFRVRTVFIGSFCRFRRISLNEFPPAPKTKRQQQHQLKLHKNISNKKRMV